MRIRPAFEDVCIDVESGSDSTTAKDKKAGPPRPAPRTHGRVISSEDAFKAIQTVVLPQEMKDEEGPGSSGFNTPCSLPVLSPLTTPSLPSLSPALSKLATVSKVGTSPEMSKLAA